ncbi:amidohydrolase family protein [Kordiimonas sp. SCSIO 12610]|uniref:metal-dependent hydrolase family protein n=1 Tax=Kordiimonas sp. SCSIO 12610 TaxID=2829597 RepID=UPI00210AFDB8|nr:amidohydrolase family protein [Kordiimonas sp. SCSIO 12610]UTW55797.1 amidohydrolase family protein [Kordiimonas sp. SCSIO 12610]
MGNLKKSLVGALLAATSIVSFGSVLQADTKVIHAGELLAVPGEAAKKQQTIVVVDGRITEVRDGFVSPTSFGNDAKYVDLKDSFVMPGLMDMHVHIQMELGPQNDSEKLRLSAADVGMQSVYFAHKTLMAGFTTVRDMGNEYTHLNALRDGVEKGWIAGPRIIAGRMVAATGGHGDIDGMRHDLLEKYTSSTICDGADDCLRAVREAVKFGADVIKITATGGVLSDTTTGTGQQMTDEEMKAIMDTAHGLGRRVAAHAHSAGGINAALRAGVDSVEHGTYADEESIRLFNENGAYLVPTLLAGDTVVQMAKAGTISSPAIRDKAIRVGADLIENFGRAYKGGVKIAYGTDSGVSTHGINAQEAVLMKQAGMSEMDIIKSATVVAAELADMSNSLGTIEAGKHADIIAVDGNPLSDISELLDVDFVMKAGTVHKNQ